MRAVRLFSLGIVLAVAVVAQGCGTSDAPALGPDSVLSDAANGGDVGGLDGNGGDTSKPDTTGTDGGGGLCGDGVCDPLESNATCPLDCKTSTRNPFQCLQAGCSAQIGNCSTDASCAVVLGCIASCSDAGCLGACRTKAFAAGATPAVQALFDCAGSAGCGNPQTAICGNLVCETNEEKTCPQDCKGGNPVCGNGVCEQGEQNGGCPDDCSSVTPFCGDGKCTGNETAFSCPSDCVPNPVCGDGLCSDGEQEFCPEDCFGGPVCGNGSCEPGESSKSCPKDCGQPGPVCGDGACSTGESAATCPADCAKPICGDKICAASESPDSCPADCGGDPMTCAKEKCADQVKVCLADPPCAKLFACFASCTDDGCYETCFKQAPDAAMASFMPLSQCSEKFCNGAVCGDGQCDGTESSKTCPKDCPTGPICGNGACEAGESSSTCPIDCGPPKPVCGNGLCESGESSASCPKDCGAPRTCGNGKCEPNESMLSCPQDCFQATDLLGCAKQNCEKDYVVCISAPACAKALDCIAKCTSTNCLQSCAAQNPASLQQLAPLGQCVQNAGCLGGSTGPVCGNNKCETGESPNSCPQDCGPPKPVCGNQNCEPGEDANVCPSDCGPGSCKNQCGGQGSNGQCWCDQQCIEFGDCCGDFKDACPGMVPVCGDGKCETGESPQNCPKDCQAPGPVCGDGICQDPEPKTCPADCAPPKPVCGNGVCELDEAKTCPKDCSTTKTCKSKADCASSEVCCNGSAGQVCVPAGQCF